jgi:uncharacterized protein (DUF736 family)
MARSGHKDGCASIALPQWRRRDFLSPRFRPFLARQENRGAATHRDDGTFTGTIRTLNINVKATIKPVAKDNERSPDYRVTANGVELGAGWSKAAKDTGAEYVSVKLDDPSFKASIYATLVQDDNGEHKLIWSR